jgi:hypothetical protein
MKIDRRLAITCALGLCSNAVFADLLNGPDPYASGYGFDKPDEAAWGGWQRGSTGSLYAEWDSFDDATHGTASDRTAKADVGSFNTSSDPYLSWNVGTFATGAKNLYSFSAAEQFQTKLSGGAGAGGAVRAVLQVEDWGTPLDLASVTLNGTAPTTAQTTFTDPAYPSSFGPVTLTQRLFYWDLPSAPGEYQFAFNSTESSLSLAQVSLDVGSIGTAPVPLPPAIWLFGSALAAMVTRGKARQPHLAV